MQTDEAVLFHRDVSLRHSTCHEIRFPTLGNEGEGCRTRRKAALGMKRLRGYVTCAIAATCNASQATAYTLVNC